MTELQWLIKILTQHKLSTSLKDLFIERIGEVETSFINPIPTPGPVFNQRPLVLNQAPSTQKILDEIAQEQNLNPVTPKPIVPRRTKEEIVTSTSTGGFTKGPKKW